MGNDQSGRDAKRAPVSTRSAVLIAALSVLAGFAAVYVTLGGRDNVPPPNVATRSAPEAASLTKPDTGSQAPGRLNVGEVAGFVVKKQPETLEAFTFTDGQGQTRTLADWKGRIVLLNLWATWCAPCRKEMPSLSRLQKALGSDKFEVVALAVDRAGAAAAAKFLGSIDAKELALYVDATARSGTSLKAVGMPTTLLLDRDGREIGRLTGPAEWDSPEAQTLIRAYLK